MQLRTLADIAAFLEVHDEIHALLCCVETLGLPEGWIGAGLIRNAIWDHLHGRATDLSMLADVDVIVFDRADVSKARDINRERRLREAVPQIPWSVKNQARMHLSNGDAPYQDIADAIAHWPETATAIAARTRNKRVEVIAPYGTDDLLNLIVRPTPAFTHKMDIYRTRVASKNWRSRWPGLVMLGL